MRKRLLISSAKGFLIASLFVGLTAQQIGFIDEAFSREPTADEFNKYRMIVEFVTIFFITTIAIYKTNADDY